MKKGILLAGGTGSRLFPITRGVSKQLLPVYDKPLFYYPLSTLMLANVKDILIIVAKENLSIFQSYFGDGSKIGINLSYAVQEKANGIAESLIIGREFIGNDDVYLILGDNIFYGSGMQDMFNTVNANTESSFVFGSYVTNPSEFGVASYDDKRSLIIEEKPINPKSNLAVTGLYFYKNNSLSYLDKLKKSKRGELEITDFNNIIVKNLNMQLMELGRGYAWFDCGTFDNLLDASSFIRTIEKTQGIKIGCVEEIAYKKGLIDIEQLKKIVNEYNTNNEYKRYLSSLL